METARVQPRYNRSMPALLVALLTLPPQSARFDVLVKGKKAGVATYRLSDRPGGGRVTRLRIALADGAVTESLSLTDASGAAVRSENVVRRGKAFTKETVTYGARGDATIVANDGKPVVVPFDRRGSRKDPSEAWLRPTVPSAGTWAVYRALDPRKRVWDEVRVTFVGKKGAGYLLRQSRAGGTTDYTLDTHGLPLVIEANDLRLVRR